MSGGVFFAPRIRDLFAHANSDENAPNSRWSLTPFLLGFPAVGLKCALNLTVLIGNFQNDSTAAWMSEFRSRLVFQSIPQIPTVTFDCC